MNEKANDTQVRGAAEYDLFYCSLSQQIKLLQLAAIGNIVVLK